MKFPCGISVYLAYDLTQIKQQIKNAHDSGLLYVFTSLHIMEEDSDVIDKAKAVLAYCRQLQMTSIVDVSPNALVKLKLNSFNELKDWGLDYLRLDFGFNHDEMAGLSRNFDLVLNASCFSEEDYQQLKQRQVDFSRIHCCHNFYPKKLSGLDLNNVVSINQRLHGYGLDVMGFVMGDYIRRGPLFDGLCTIEDQRNEDVLYNLLTLFFDAHCNVALCGDFGLKEETYRKLSQLSEGYIECRCTLNDDAYRFVLNQSFHDRRDYSPYLIRCVESRQFHNRDIVAQNTEKRPAGSLCLSNNDFLRYSGELEIMKKDAEADQRVNVIGRIVEEDVKYLRFVNETIAIKLTD